MFNEPKCIDKSLCEICYPESGACIGCLDSSRDFVRFGEGKCITFNHVHDAFLLHCGDVEIFLSVVKDIYRKKFFNVSQEERLF